MPPAKTFVVNASKLITIDVSGGGVVSGVIVTGGDGELRY
jgi:hypothetical protein